MVNFQHPVSYTHLDVYKRQGWEKSDDRMVISFIEAGSIIFPEIDIFHTGRSVASPFDARAIVFGNAFLYPLFNNEMEG